jgi:hypothetical protein
MEDNDNKDYIRPETADFSKVQDNYDPFFSAPPKVNNIDNQVDSLLTQNQIPEKKAFDYTTFLYQSEMIDKKRKGRKIALAIVIYIVLVVIVSPILFSGGLNTSLYIPEEYLLEYYPGYHQDSVYTGNQIYFNFPTLSGYNCNKIYFLEDVYGNGVLILYFDSIQDSSNYYYDYESFEEDPYAEIVNNNDYYYKIQGITMVMGSEAALELTELTFSEWMELYQRAQEEGVPIVTS